MFYSLLKPHHSFVYALYMPVAVTNYITEELHDIKGSKISKKAYKLIFALHNLK
jgi:hypothetical protein